MKTLIRKLRGEQPEFRPERAPAVTAENLEKMLASGFEWLTNSHPGEDRDLGDLMGATDHYSFVGQLTDRFGEENVATGIPLKDGIPMDPEKAGDYYGVYVRKQ